ncbi:MAG: sulfotransferase [Magnetococcales bacterium]|nr:sulfotransferase [Magnetococcales bacterium]
MTTPHSSSTFTKALAAFEKALTGMDPESALSQARTLVKRFPKEWSAWRLLAQLERQAGQAQGALTTLEKGLKQLPQTASLWFERGHLLRLAGHHKPAIESLSQALILEPTLISALEEMGLILMGLGQIKQAAAFFQKIVAQDPNHLTALNNLAIIAVRMGDYQTGERLYRHGLAQHPHQAILHCGLGSLLKGTNRHEAAETSYRQATQLAPHFAPAWFGLGGIALDRGELKAAREHFLKALEQHPDFGEVWPHLAKTHRYGPQDQEEIQKMEAALNNPHLSATGRIDLHFALGKVHDDCQAWDRAFHHYDQGNILKRPQAPFDSEAHIQLVQRLIARFSPEWFEKWRDGGLASRRPIFVVGLPRSGTSLVEQILASHPQAFGAGELEHMHALSQTLPTRLNHKAPYPDTLEALTLPHLRRLGQDYLQEIDALSQGAARVINKMPGDFFHLGLIRTLFPKATLIHCRRNLLDTALSIYFQNFLPSHGYAFSLDGIAAYVEGYATLTEQWRNCFPDLLEIIYEDLVTEPEPHIRRLIDHCGLEWDPACLSFHRSRRMVNTASNAQVREPVHRRSVARWEHYQEYIQPLVQRLTPLQNRLEKPLNRP